jgi:hypothetical protein
MIAASGTDPSAAVVWEHNLHPAYHDGLTLVPPSGVMRNDGRVFGSPIEKPRDTAYRKGTTEIIWDTMAMSAFQDAWMRWIPRACHTDTLSDHGPRLYRWRNAASAMAIGMDPDEPVVTHDLLHAACDVAVWRHDAIRRVLEPFDPDDPPCLTVVQ